MAYTTGTARHSRDMVAHVVDFVTTQLGTANWSLMRGQRNVLAVDLINYTTYDEHLDPLQVDVSVAMGWGDYGSYDQPHDLNTHYPCWSCYITDVNPYLGFEAATTAQVYSYEVVARVWHEGEEDYADDQVSSWVIEYSNDGTSWSTADTESDHSWTSGQSKTFSINQDAGNEKIAKFWRLRVLDNNGGEAVTSVGRLRFRNSGGTVISNSYSPEYVLKAPGYTGDKDIYIGFSFHEDITEDYYNVRHSSFLSWDSDAYIWDQILVSSRYTTMWNSDIPYHMVANAQKVMFSAKISTVSEFVYLGFILPYATPLQYPFPCLNSGMTNVSDQRWSIVDTHDYDYYFGNLQRGDNGTTVFVPEQTWLPVIGDTKVTNCVLVWPQYSGFRIDIHPGDDGTYTVLPYILFSDYGGNKILGEVEGIFWVSGVQNAFEDIITIGGKDYFVFQNRYRTEARDYACMLLE